MTEHTLNDTPVETWGNTILYRLAEALEYPRDAAGGYTANPDEILDDAPTNGRRGTGARLLEVATGPLPKLRERSA